MATHQRLYHRLENLIATFMQMKPMTSNQWIERKFDYRNSQVTIQIKSLIIIG